MVTLEIEVAPASLERSKERRPMKSWVSAMPPTKEALLICEASGLSLRIQVVTGTSTRSSPAAPPMRVVVWAVRNWVPSAISRELAASRKEWGVFINLVVKNEIDRCCANLKFYLLKLHRIRI